MLALGQLAIALLLNGLAKATLQQREVGRLSFHIAELGLPTGPGKGVLLQEGEAGILPNDAMVVGLER
jgi:hypothetical protein